MAGQGGAGLATMSAHPVASPTTRVHPAIRGPPLQLLERRSRPRLRAPRLLLPAWQAQGTRVLSLPPRGTNHTTEKKHTITRASEAGPDLSPFCWTQTCLSLPKTQPSHWHLHDVLTSGPLHLLFPLLECPSSGSWPGQVLLDTYISAQCHPLKEGVR